MVATAALSFLWTALARLLVSTVTSCHADLVCHSQSAAVLSWSTPVPSWLVYQLAVRIC